MKDSVSGSVDDMLTAGGVAELNGINIKLSGDNDAVGLYFFSQSVGEFKAATIVTNKPSHVVALIPQLPSGTYQIKVVTQYSGGKALKDPKTTVYGKIFTVA